MSRSKIIMKEELSKLIDMGKMVPLDTMTNRLELLRVLYALQRENGVLKGRIKESEKRVNKDPIEKRDITRYELSVKEDIINSYKDGYNRCLDDLDIKEELRQQLFI